MRGKIIKANELKEYENEDNKVVKVYNIIPFGIIICRINIFNGWQGAEHRNIIAY